MTNAEFIHLHAGDDPARLALQPVPEGVDRVFCLGQIKSRQRAARKIPAWVSVCGLLFPPGLSVEQCSSEATAAYKANLVRRHFPAGGAAMADLTGGFGVDFVSMAPLFQDAAYVERQEELCALAAHNFPLLGISNVQIVEGSAEDFLQESVPFDLIFLDPARRDDVGRKVFRIEDCSPSVTELLPLLRQKSRRVLLKLSPMLDVRASLRSLGFVREVHCVSVEGECRELLLWLDFEEGAEGQPVQCHCVDIGRNGSAFFVEDIHSLPQPVLAEEPMAYLYEPGAAVLKAGVQDSLGARFGLKKLHPNSQLFTANAPLDEFPGRAFRVVAQIDFGKRSLKALRSEISSANITVRNFPASVDEVRRRLGLKEGGSDYLFVTTLADGRHVVIWCKKTTNQ